MLAQRAHGGAREAARCSERSDEDELLPQLELDVVRCARVGAGLSECRRDARGAVGNPTLQLTDDDALKRAATFDHAGLHSRDTYPGDSTEQRAAWHAQLDEAVGCFDAVQEGDNRSVFPGDLFDYRGDGIERITFHAEDGEIGGAQVFDSIGGRHTNDG